MRYILSILFSQCILICSLWGQSGIQESLHLTTDRDVYLSGEQILVQLTCVDAAFQQKINLSKVAYIELWSQNGQLLSTTPVSLENSKASTLITIPSATNSSFHLLRAYTRWMLNKQEGDLPQKVLSVINPEEGIVIESTASISTNDTLLSFFPRGGNIVAGIPQELLIRAQDLRGKGVSLTQYISELDQTISTNQEGYEIKKITPTPAQVAFLNSSNKYLNKLSLAVESHEQGPVRLTITLTPSVSGSIFLQLSKGGVSFPANQIPVVDQKGSLTFLPPPIFSGGIRMDIIDGKQNILASSYIKRDSEPHHVISQLKERTYKPGSLIDLESTFFPNLPTDTNLQWSLSLSAHIASAEAPPNAQLTTSFVSPPLSTQSGISAEYYGHEIMASIKNYSAKKHDKSIAYLAIVGEHSMIYTTAPDEQGILRWNIQDIHGLQDMVAFCENMDGEGFDIEWLQPMPTNKPTFPLHQMTFNAGDQEQIQLAIQRQEMADAFEVKPNFPPPIGPKANFFGQATEIYNLDEYTRFVMPETFTEIIYHIRLRKKDGSYELRLEDRMTETLLQGNPLFLIDGIPFRDVNAIMKLRSQEVDRIALFRRPFYLGNERRDGIVQLISKQADGKLMSLPPHYLSRTYQFPNQPLPSFSLLDEVKQERPATGNLLHFEEGNGFFEGIRLKSPLIPGAYMIRILIHQKEGLPLEYSLPIRVLEK
ncbi:MAG: hypothetical protein AAFY71_11130 [Bacteroidota bacterium]